MRGLAPPPGFERLARRLPPSTPGIVGALAGLAGLLCTAVWLATGGHFWPVWPWLGLSTGVALVAWWTWGSGLGGRLVLRHTVFTLIVAAACVGMWLAAGADGVFWPKWVLVGAIATLGIHAIFSFRDRLPGARRERVLVARVDRLEQTRRGALDVQAAELRRIERDLHDGAQARLVALTMRLGRAEARLDADPEAAALVRAARDDASAAIAELRDLARGIAPPVLADRGLLAAVEALGERAPLPVLVRGGLRARPVPVVETAAYFVASEALTNVAKHAPRAAATVDIEEDGDELRLLIADDGPGGAVPTGSGLTGLRQRVEALDGRFEISSPPEGGTRVEVHLPCAS